MCQALESGSAGATSSTVVRIDRAQPRSWKTKARVRS
jgi:hypothetical protein